MVLASVVPALGRPSGPSPSGVAYGSRHFPATVPVDPGPTGPPRSAPTGCSTRWPRTDCLAGPRWCSTSAPPRRPMRSQQTGLMSAARSPQARDGSGGARQPDGAAAASRPASTRRAIGHDTVARCSRVRCSATWPWRAIHRARQGRARSHHRVAGGGRVKTILTGGLSEAPWMPGTRPGIDAIDWTRPHPPRASPSFTPRWRPPALTRRARHADERVGHRARLEGRLDRPRRDRLHRGVQGGRDSCAPSRPRARACSRS